MYNAAFNILDISASSTFIPAEFKLFFILSAVISSVSDSMLSKAIPDKLSKSCLRTPEVFFNSLKDAFAPPANSSMFCSVSAKAAEEPDERIASNSFLFYLKIS